MTSGAMPGVKAKSVLMTPDPYHTPGYGGFCPQFKYQIGETFGRTTSRLLGDNDVASSGRLVLAYMQPTTTDTDRITEARLNLLRARTQSWGDQKLVENMVPGYTGFIPKSQHHFGKRYAKNCVRAISDFENDQRGHNKKIAELYLTEALQSGRQIPDNSNLALPEIKTSYVTPLNAVSKTRKPYISLLASPHSLSPHYMCNDNPEKRYMSGYTGFVPRAREKLGAGYPLITHFALNDFTDDLMRLKSLDSDPVQIHRKEMIPVDTKPVYPVDSGLVPHYTGHIPGEKFRYGQTFGHSTKNAMVNKRDCVSSSV